MLVTNYRRACKFCRVEFANYSLLEVHRQKCQVPFTEWIDFTATHLTTLKVEWTSATMPIEMGGFTNLTELTFDGKPLNDLTGTIGQLTALETLNVLGCRLCELPPEIGLLTRLVKLDLSRNGLERIPDEIGALTNLKCLDFSGNFLRYLPPSFACLTALETLSLAANCFVAMSLNARRRVFCDPSSKYYIADAVYREKREMEDKAVTEHCSMMMKDEDWDSSGAIYSLTRLTDLNLFRVGLKSLSPEISRLVSLKTLQLASNDLPFLPREIAALQSLTELDVNDNEMETLPSEIGRLTALQVLRFGWDKMVTYPLELGSISKSLKWLCIRPGAWEGSPWLREYTKSKKKDLPQRESLRVRVFFRYMLNVRTVLLFFAHEDWIFLRDIMSAVMELLAKLCVAQWRTLRL